MYYQVNPGPMPMPLQPQPVAVRMPLVRQPVGLGDVLRQITQRLGVPPCAPCEARRQTLNQRFVLRPW